MSADGWLPCEDGLEPSVLPLPALAWPADAPPPEWPDMPPLLLRSPLECDDVPLPWLDRPLDELSPEESDAESEPGWLANCCCNART